jgi:hypothetical protein
MRTSPRLLWMIFDSQRSLVRHLQADEQVYLRVSTQDQTTANQERELRDIASVFASIQRR